MTFQDDYATLRGRLLQQTPIEVGKWHNVSVAGSKQHLFRELLDVRFTRIMAPRIDQSQAAIKPNLPWAEDHFQERVSGKPLNPPPSQSWWPFGNTQRHQTEQGEAFSHSYPERFWPRHAGPHVSEELGKQRTHMGIRFQYGDLDDVVNLLAREPMTRQAVLPVWFPEDTGNHADVRLPCSLTYQFTVREGRMRCTYNMRSVEFRRHFRDDVYMAERLTQWICDRLNESDWDHHDPLEPGMLTMNMANLHLLEGDVEWARSEAISEAL